MAKIRVNLLTFTAGRQTTGFHALDSMWTTSRACAVAFNSPQPLPVGRRRPIRRQYLRVSIPKTGPLRFRSENQFPLNFAHEYILVQKKLKPH